ncbi:MAG: immunoglobulin domain-containing protein, partial [Limisphaerales bacterium]
MKTSSRSLWAKCIRTLFLFTTALLLTVSVHATGTATVVLRPSNIDISSASAQGAVLVTLTGYTSGSAPKYRLFNGSAQYSTWDAPSGTFITSSTYANNPSAVGDYVNGTTFWILYQAGGNLSATASYRDRLTPYSANNNTAALPAATAITSPFNITGSVASGAGYDLTVRYAVLGFDASANGNLICASFTDLATGSFVLVCPTGTTISRVEFRTITNTIISAATKTGTWNSTTSLGTIPFSGGTAGPATQVRVETAADGGGTQILSRSIAAGTPLNVYAIARDVNGLFVANTNVAWSLTSKVGVVDGDLVPIGDNKSATFTGHITGTATIHADATAISLTSGDSGTITVTNGAPTQLRIETQTNGTGSVIGSHTLPTGNSLVAWSIRRDTYGNFVDNVAADSWSLTSIGGGVVAGDLAADAGNKFATLTGNATGNAVITATSGALTGNSGTITVAAVAPTITAPPPSYTTNAGTSVTFFVSVSGSTPLTYQWKKNGVNISGKTDATLILNGIANADAGSYSVGVTNSSGGTESAAGTLTVNVNAFTLMTYNVKGNF